MGYPAPPDFADPLRPGAEDRLLAEVGPGEKVVWSGQPRTSRFVLATIPILIFGLFWTGFSIFWVVIAFLGSRQGGVSLIFPLFGLPFVLIGFGMLGSPLWAASKARRIVYALTDRRLILIEPTFAPGGSRVVSLRGNEIGPIERLERGDGSGNLTFGRPIVFDQAQGSAAVVARHMVGIPHVREVESLIRQTLLKEGDAAR